ncbi:MAG: alkaline phosphatase D family protein [Baekduia sp.]
MSMVRGDVSRRQFIATGVAGAVSTYAFADPLLERALAAVPLATDVAFNSGVACGQVAANAITLWTQVDGLVPTLQDPDPTVRLTVQIAKDPGFTNVVARTEALASFSTAGTARVRVRGRALEPHEQYYYRFVGATASSRVGKFRTPPPPDSQETIKAAFFACQDFGTGFYSAHKDMAAQDVDLVVSLGDYIYEDAYFLGAVRDLPKTPDGQVRTLDEYRNQYRTYNADQYLQDVRAMAPLEIVFDDHEVEDNWAGDLPGGNGAGLAGSGAGRDIPFLDRKANGFKAFFEASPIIRNVRDPNRIYGAQRYGQLELIKLDTRSFRTNQPCNESDAFVGFCTDLNQTLDPNATLMGPTQRNWLLRRLKNSDAPWRLIANQVMIQSLDIIFRDGPIVNTDAWDGYGAERAYVCDFIEKNGIKNTHWMTGDIHTFFAGHVTRTGRAPGHGYLSLEGGPSVGTEFVISSITSQGIPDRVSYALFEGGLHNQFEFDLEEGIRNALAGLVDGIVYEGNPHMAFSGSSYKGYGLVELNSNEMKVKYRATHNVKNPNSAPFTFASFKVDKNSNTIQRDATAAARRTKLPINNSQGFGKSDAEKAILDFFENH